MMNTSYHIANLLDKMTSADKDFRFMATNDLMSELQKDAIKLDEDCERKIVKMLLKLLEDKNGEVQNLAVKCMGPLVNKVKEHHVEVIVDTLCANMLSDQEQLRDVSSIGLKTVIDQLPATGNVLTCNTCRRVTPKIVAAVHGGPNADVAIQLEGLDILADLLLRYGGILANYHQSIQEALIPLLSSGRLAVRKRTITALAYLVNVCNLNQFNSVCDSLLNKLQQCQDISVIRTYVNCVGAISKSSGNRFGFYLPRVVPTFIKFCENYDDDELREGCLQSFESIILKCPKEAAPHLPAILALCTKYLCHDPNYQYDDNDISNGGQYADMDVDGDRASLDGYSPNGAGGGGGGLNQSADEDDEEQQQEYSDDDDMSWKVRRASAKCLEAALSTRRELLTCFYTETAPLIVSRFKEREENVKADIFRGYISLLKHTKIVVPVADPKFDEHGLLPLLQHQLPKLLRAVSKQLKEKSLKTRQSCFALLVELLRVLPGALTDHMNIIIPGVQFSLNDKSANSNTKIDTLNFLGVALTTHPFQVFVPYVNTLVPLIVNAVNDPFYKVTAEALSVVQQFVRVLRPLDVAPTNNLSWPPYVDLLYTVVFNKLKTTDIDQEVKERAISCMGHLLATFGDYLQKEVPNCLVVLLERLKNEVTRLTTVRAMVQISQSTLKISLQPIFGPMVRELVEFLRKNHRSLRLSTLQLLSSLTINYESLLGDDLIRAVMAELPALISESDLQIAQMAVRLLTDLLRVNSACLAANIQPSLTAVVRLIRSPLLQGATLNVVRTFLTQLVSAELQWPQFNHLKDILTKTAYEIAQSSASSAAMANAAAAGTSSTANSYQTSGAGHHGSVNNRQAYQNSAKCLASLVAARPNQANETINELIGNLRENSRCNDQVQLFSLLALGEIGRECPKAVESRQVEQSVLRGFQSHCEEIKSAASQALGSLAVGNLEKFLPFVLNEIQSQPKRQYMLLHSLKEIISSESTSVEVDSILPIFKPHIDEIWTVLMSHAECSEEGVRNVVAECLGKLCLLEPVRLLPRLKDGLKAERSAFMRATIITALKFTIVDSPQPVDHVLKENIGDFLQSIDDPDLTVRRVALITLNSAAHNKPALIRDNLVQTLPGVYRETKVRKELIREVEMGPFRHTVDDGLDLRKSAFECMYTLLETCLERLDIFEFLQHVEDGLKDHYDIKMLTYLMLIRLANLCPTQVLQRLDRLVEPLKQTCSAKVKANAVKQEFEKQDELKRCALRSILALQSVAESEKNTHLNDLLQMIKTTPDLFQLYETVQKDYVNRSYYESGHSMEVD